MYRPIFARPPLACLTPFLRVADLGRRCFPFSVLTVCTLMALTLAVPTLQASEPASAPTEHSTQVKDAKAASAKGEGKPDKAEKATAGKPPAESSPEAMDKLREKLAQRLGAVRAPTSKSPYDLQVSGRNPEAPPAKAGARPKAGSKATSEAVGAMEAHSGPAHWAYTGAGGPEAWASLKPEFAACSSGQRQSPIDIRDSIQVQMPAIQFDYKPSGFSVLDNGHTVQVNLPPGNGITVNNRRYELLQFHFHRPSEERINGKPFDMVAHLVHKDAEGKLAVVAVLLERGSAQPVVQAVWNALPLEKNEDTPAPGSIDVSQLLPKDQRFYTYMGSLTTPPCSEGVLWLVLKQPVQLSPEQLNIFSRMYPMNARPIQPGSGRMIKESS